jgi:hypothetical protein
MIAMPVGDAVSDRVREFDYAAEQLMSTYDRILAAEPIASELGGDIATAWGLAYAVTHHARTVLNSATIEDWDLDALDEDDCHRRTAIIFNGWMAGESFLLASGIARNFEGPAGAAENPPRND